MRSDKDILELWLSYTPKELDDVCLSVPARLAIDELREKRKREPLVQEVIRHARDFVSKEAPHPQDLTFEEQCKRTCQRIEYRAALLEACRKLAEFRP